MNTTTAPLTARERAEIDAANASGKQPVLFVHGLWLLADSWAAWREAFETAGYATVAADWPDDPADVATARANPDVFAGKSVGQIADHVSLVAKALDRAPILVGHSFGGGLVQIVAGRGLAAATVAIDPAPTRGVLTLPISSLKAAFPVLGKPANRKKAITLTFEQFRFAFANAVSEKEAHDLYERYHVAGSGIPLFQAALANVNPGSDLKVDRKRADRGAMLFISGENDNTVPWAIANASYKKQAKNAATTGIIEIPGRGHSLVIDSGVDDVIAPALAFARQHVPA